MLGFFSSLSSRALSSCPSRRCNTTTHGSSQKSLACQSSHFLFSVGLRGDPHLDLSRGSSVSFFPRPPRGGRGLPREGPDRSRHDHRRRQTHPDFVRMGPGEAELLGKISYLGLLFRPIQTLLSPSRRVQVHRSNDCFFHLMDKVAPTNV